MAKAPRKQTTDAISRVTVEPGADKRLAGILKAALNTPPTHKPTKPGTKAASAKAK